MAGIVRRRFVQADKRGSGEGAIRPGGIVDHVVAQNLQDPAMHDESESHLRGLGWRSAGLGVHVKCMHGKCSVPKMQAGSEPETLQRQTRCGQLVEHGGALLVQGLASLDLSRLMLSAARKPTRGNLDLKANAADTKSPTLNPESRSVHDCSRKSELSEHGGG